MTTSIIPNLWPLNDLAFVATLKTVDPATGKAIPLSSGTVTAFLATTNTPTATAADPSLTATATYLGSRGKWLIQFDASVLTAALLASLFGSTTPYLIVVQTGGVRTVAELAYTPTRLAIVTA